MHKKTSGNGMKVGMIAAGVATAAAAYFFLGPKGKKHQKQARAWVIKMKGDVVEKLEMAREMSEPIYNEIVDSVAAEYRKGMRAGNEEIDEVAEDLKKHWKNIGSGARAVKRDAVKGAKRVARKAGL